VESRSGSEDKGREYVAGVGEEGEVEMRDKVSARSACEQAEKLAIRTHFICGTIGNDGIDGTKWSETTLDSCVDIAVSADGASVGYACGVLGNQLQL
jgi:hypothetical protein